MKAEPIEPKHGGFLSFLERTYWTGRQYNAMRMDQPQLRQEQQNRLRNLLTIARTRSPFYRNKFCHLDASCVDLAQFPVTTKAEMMANFDQVVTDPAVTRAGVERFIEDIRNVQEPFLGKYCVSHTSGSQGQPALIVQNQLVLDLFFAFQMTRGNPDFRGLKRFTQAAGNLLRPTRLAVIISQQGFFPSAWVWQRLPGYMRRFMRFLFLPANDPDLVARLNDFSPTVLTATPTTLDLLSLKTGQLRFPRLRQVVTWSETLTEPARRRIGGAFGVPVMDNYAMGECMFLTNGCPATTGAHVNADWVILEVVDEQNQPVPPGQLGHKILMTNLANTVQPFIRYEIGDRLVMATEPCGSAAITCPALKSSWDGRPMSSGCAPPPASAPSPPTPSSTPSITCAMCGNGRRSRWNAIASSSVWSPPRARRLTSRPPGAVSMSA